MKNILCFGDSNTWGYEPGTGQRFAFDVRWTGVLQHSLDTGYRVIEGGLNGRTTIFEDETRDYRNGISLLPAFLESHSPLDLVIIMLGTNDLKTFFDMPVSEIAQGAKMLCETILKHHYTVGQCPQILLVSPSLVEEMPPEDDKEFIGAIAKSRQFATHYKSVADALNVHFFDAAQVIKTSVIDGVHWDPCQHGAFGKAIADAVVEIVADTVN